jgi:hypothetical protein
VQYGPERTRVKSSTVRPASGPVDALRSLRVGLFGPRGSLGAVGIGPF